MFPFSNSKVDLIKQQKNLFLKIFSKTQNTWKIIIFDQANHDIISSLFKVKDFRQHNITMYFSIKQERQQLHGISAIYIVKPNLQNIEEITKDFEKQLYSSVVIHFSSEPPSTFLSSFAKQLAKRKPSALHRIQKIEFSNIGFQCVDRKMCILPENNELINLLVTLKNEPIFIYSSNQQTQVDLIKNRLLSSSFKLSNQDVGSKKPKQYTQVLIFNRQADLFPIVSHGITYASLMQDVWKFNRLGTKIIEKDALIDLNDQIWLDRKNMLISEMDLDKQCNKIKGRMLNATTEQTSQLTQKNKKIEWHITNASQIIKQAKQRRLNQFHAIQQSLHINKSLLGQNKSQFIELLQTAPEKPDKIRLILCYMLSVENYDQNQVQEFQRIVPEVKSNKFYSQLKQKRSQNEDLKSSNSKYIKKLAKGIWKNLYSEQKKFLLVKYLEKIKDLTEKNLNDLGLSMSSLREIPLNAEIQNTVVYCVGGICFNQYANLAQYHPSVIYCGDKLINFRELV